MTLAYLNKGTSTPFQKPFCRFHQASKQADPDLFPIFFYPNQHNKHFCKCNIKSSPIDPKAWDHCTVILLGSNLSEQVSGVLSCKNLIMYSTIQIPWGRQISRAMTRHNVVNFVFQLYLTAFDILHTETTGRFGKSRGSSETV